MVRYFHDWPPEEGNERFQGCEQPRGTVWRHVYIQTAIDDYSAQPCPKCFPGDTSDKVAYDVFIEPDPNENARRTLKRQPPKRG